MGSFWTEGYARHLKPLRPQNRRWMFVAIVVASCLLVFQTMNYMPFVPLARMGTGMNLVLEDEPSEPSRSSLDDLFPVMLPDRDNIYENENNREMRALIQCMKAENCPENRKSVVLLSASHFGAMLLGFKSGEHIWAESIVTALREMNYTILFSYPFGSDGPKDGLEVLKHYHYFPDLVKIVIAEGDLINRCFKDGNCIKTPNFPGIPAWKFLEWTFWPSPEHPLGRNWTINPYPYDPPNGRDIFYLGFSIERACTKLDVVPPAERLHRAFVYGKGKAYFSSRDYSWPGLSFAAFPLPGVGAVHTPDTAADDPGLPAGLRNLGAVPRARFVAELARSKVLVGVGSPPHSPTPYEALCMGVPFVNPIKDWDRADPGNRARWDSQHQALRWLDPPYVYNVRAGDLGGLRAAVEQAVANPIGRYIDPGMTMDALKARLETLIHTDWKAKGQQVLDERRASARAR